MSEAAVIAMPGSTSVHTIAVVPVTVKDRVSCLMCVLKVKDIEWNVQRISEVSASSTRNLRRIKVAMLALLGKLLAIPNQNSSGCVI